MAVDDLVHFWLIPCPPDAWAVTEGGQREGGPSWSAYRTGAAWLIFAPQPAASRVASSVSVYRQLQLRLYTFKEDNIADCSTSPASVWTLYH